MLMHLLILYEGLDFIIIIPIIIIIDTIKIIYNKK